MKLALVTILALIFTAACSNETPQQTQNQPTQSPATPLPVTAPPNTPNTASSEVPKDPNEVATPSGLRYVDIVQGTGEQPKQGQVVLVHYTGTLPNGRKFDSSVDRGQPFKFVLGAGMVIKGWDEGIATMKVGGKRKLIIPPQLGYGSSGAGGGVIPPNATLLFDVELLGIQ